jgi:hypothetical protein
VLRRVSGLTAISFAGQSRASSQHETGEKELHRGSDGQEIEKDRLRRKVRGTLTWGGKRKRKTKKKKKRRKGRNPCNRMNFSHPTETRLEKKN